MTSIDNSAIIDPSATIDPSVKIGKNVFIGPNSIIGPNCEIGDGTQINPFAIIRSNTKIGKNNRIFSFVVIGEEAQILTESTSTQNTFLEIGDNNIIREFSNIHRGSESSKSKTTKVGNNNLIMSHCHIAHDCELSNSIVLSAKATLGGHVFIDNYAVVGGLSTVHQFSRIGERSMVGGSSGVLQDVVSFVTVFGLPAKSVCVNYRGMQRAKINKDTIQNIKKSYNILFRSNLSQQDALEKIKALPQSRELDSFINSILTSTRGLSYPKKFHNYDNSNNN